MLQSSSARRVARFIATCCAPSTAAQPATPSSTLSAASRATSQVAPPAPRAAHAATSRRAVTPAGPPLRAYLRIWLRTCLRAHARTAVAALSVAALCSACAMPKHPDSEAAPPDPFNPAATQLLDDTGWVLSGWKQADGTARAVPPAAQGAPITLVLSTDKGQRHASGFSGCNRYMGSYTLKDGKLSFGTLGGTRMACMTPGGQIEGAYLNALAHIDRTGVQMREPQQMQLVLDNGDTLTFDRSAK